MKHISTSGLKAFLLAPALLAAFGCRVVSAPPPEPIAPSGRFTSYSASVQPILDRRCVICHSCYDAPCQLNQTAFAGLDRGASKANVYADRLFKTEPTRLFIDAKSTAEWRKKGFFPVLQHHPAGDTKNLEESILYQLIRMRQDKPVAKLPYDAFSSRSCPNLGAGIDQLEQKVLGLLDSTSRELLAMPYGFPSLTTEEFLTLRDWLLAGAPGPEPKGRDAANPEHPQVTRWEAFLNNPSPKHRLTARYLYEHLFLGHLYFSDDRAPSFYRLVRSRTAAPAAVDEIPSRFPYDDPGSAPFYYRLRPLEETIVHKTHLPYDLGGYRLGRITELFIEPPWELDAKDLPGYKAERSANPFLTFRAIPAESRYRFMLDTAQYFVDSFMKGPVCRGQIALNVLQDHFFIFFLDPAADQSVQNPRYFHATARALITPFGPDDLLASEEGSSLWQVFELAERALKQLRYRFYPFFKARQLAYLKARDKYYSQARPDGWVLGDIWDGDGGNPNAVLTAYRHFDSASVTTGAHGGIPKTALVIDYPIFERLYYSLVASFDIFGDIKHQLSTRLYMDDLRIEAEDLFLSFLPLERRAEVRNYWYRKAERSINSDNFPFYGTNVGSRRDTLVQFPEGKEASPAALMELILARRIRGAAAGQSAGKAQADPLDAALRALSGRTGRHLRALPDLSLVRFQSAAGNAAAVYTLIRNRAHYNVKYLFREEDRLEPEADTLSVMRGIHGSYPNFFFDVPPGRGGEFVEQLLALDGSEASFEQLVASFGVRRSDPRIWELSDWLHSYFRRKNPAEAGVLDLNRYANY